MTVQQKHEEETICHCAEKDEFKSMSDTDHIITTSPDLIKNNFPIIYNLCNNGAKFQAQTKWVTKPDFNDAIQQFRTSVEQKYGRREYKLLNWSQLLKSLLGTFGHKKIFSIKQETNPTPEETQVNKDGNGIAFVCMTVAHKLTKRFITDHNHTRVDSFN